MDLLYAAVDPRDGLREFAFAPNFELAKELLEALQGTAFQPAPGETFVTAPLTFGGPMREPA